MARPLIAGGTNPQSWRLPYHAPNGEPEPLRKLLERRDAGLSAATLRGNIPDEVLRQSMGRVEASNGLVRATLHARVDISGRVCRYRPRHELTDRGPTH